MTVIVFVPDIAEFSPLVKAAGDIPGVVIISPKLGYWQIQAAERLSFNRKSLGLRHALWNTALTGGYCGRLKEYTNDSVIIESED